MPATLQLKNFLVKRNIKGKDKTTTALRLAMEYPEKEKVATQVTSVKIRKRLERFVSKRLTMVSLKIVTGYAYL